MLGAAPEIGAPQDAGHEDGKAQHAQRWLQEIGGHQVGARALGQQRHGRVQQQRQQRRLDHQKREAADQAEAVFLFLSDRLGKTTGQILTVDGGLPDAFLR